MEVRVNIPPEAMKHPKTGAYIAREFLRAVIKANQYWLKRHPETPNLYDTKVVYAREPNAYIYEEFADIPTVLARGWGDCDDLASWRVAELRERFGEPKADILVYWRRLNKPGQRPKTLWHIQVRRQNGDVEDPSRLLGM